MIAFNVQVSVKDHCCQDKLGGDIYYTYSSHVKCNFFACVFWPKLWLLWHYDRILLSFITYITSSLSIDRSFPKKSTLWPYVIIMMQKGCTLCGILSTLILIGIISHPVYQWSCLWFIHRDAIFSQNRLFCLLAVSRSCNIQRTTIDDW